MVSSKNNSSRFKKKQKVEKETESVPNVDVNSVKLFEFDGTRDGKDISRTWEGKTT